MPPTSIEETIEKWTVPRKPHCSNCLNAVVSGDPRDPVVRCKAGHGNTPAISLFRLIRAKSPRGFMQAHLCPDYKSMSDVVL